jgi:hypothetical protein
MRIGLSSAAAPDASLDELFDACTRRGLPALELEAGHGHGLDVGDPVAANAVEAGVRAAASGVLLSGYRVAHGDGVDPDVRGSDVEGMTSFALRLGTPLIMPVDLALSLTRSQVADGVHLLVALPPGAAAAATLDRLDAAGPVGAAMSVAWDVDPANSDVSLLAPEIMARAGWRLRHIRLLGGGPEGAAQEGRGVGSLMARLALAGFGGTVALAPSSDRYRVVWGAWLGRRGGWGCGSVAEERSLVSLVTP